MKVFNNFFASYILVLLFHDYLKNSSTSMPQKGGTHSFIRCLERVINEFLTVSVVHFTWI